MAAYIDISADLGEGFGRYRVTDDEALLRSVSSANIACGYHAGDPRTMAFAVEQAVKRGVGVGAHPGFPDREGFGRRDMELSRWEVTTDVLYQLGALSAFVKAFGGRIGHLFPHGRFERLANDRTDYAAGIVDAILLFDPSIVVLAQKGRLLELAREKGLRTASPVFADRAYNDDGTLVHRSRANAVIHDPEEVVRRSVRLAAEGRVTTVSGKDIELSGSSLLLHGDTPGSAGLAARIRAALTEAGVEIRKLEDQFGQRERGTNL